MVDETNQVLATDEQIAAVKARAAQLLDDGLEPHAVIEKLIEEIGTSRENVENILAAKPSPTTPAPFSGLVETSEQAAEINAHRTAEDGYVKVGDTV